MSSITKHPSKPSVQPEAHWKTILEVAAIEVFQLMAGARLVPNPASSREPHGEKTAMVGLAGALRGMATIRCSNQTATKLASLMLESSGASNQATSDALGELCNMVAGDFKSKISTLADHCMLSVPTVISGEDYFMQHSESTETFQVALTYEGDPIWVSIIIHP